MYSDPKLAAEAREAAQLNEFSKIGKILQRNENGRYKVAIMSGGVMDDITIGVAGLKFMEGDYVTLEFFGGDWQIVGRSARRGGD